MSQFTEVTNESWFSRIGSSIKSVLFGLLLFVISFPLLWWNEGRAVKTAKSLDEGAAAVVSISADAIDSGNDGKLVHLTGTASTDEVLTDNELGVSSPAIKLERKVEMYQWDEDEHTETKKKTGGGTTKKTTYSYEERWSSNLIDSSRFKVNEGHSNPSSMPYSSRELIAEKVILGDFTLSSGLVGKINTWKPLAPGQPSSSASPALKLSGNQFYLGSDPATPKIGDVRIGFRIVPPSAVSIIAQQSGSILAPYNTKAGRALEMLTPGVHSADEMFQAAAARNSMMTWILRMVGCLLMFFGLFTIFRPLAVVADVVPFLGSALAGGIGLFAILVTLPLALTTIAIAWIAYRPLLGVGLLVVAVGTVVGVRMLIGKKKQTTLPPLPTS